MDTPLPIRLQRFTAAPNQEIFIEISQLFLLMPIFRWDKTENRYVDATGDYDLLMDYEGTQYLFINRTTKTFEFAYRYQAVRQPRSI